MRRPCRRVELHHLPTGRVLAWEHSPQSLARQLARAEDIAGECAVADEQYREPGGDRGAADLPAPARAGLRLVRLPGALPGGERRSGRRAGRGMAWTSTPRPPWSAD